MTTMTTTDRPEGRRGTVRTEDKYKTVIDGDVFADYYSHLGKAHPAHQENYKVDEVFYDAKNVKTHVTFKKMRDL
jgi:hypothetical protein